MDEVSQPIPTPQAPTQSGVQSQQTNNSHWLKTLSIGLGVIGIGLLIGIGGYILGTKKSQSPVQKVVVQPSPTPTPDPTATWKTYIGKNFSFKYPNSGNISSGSSQTLISISSGQVVPYFIFTLRIQDNPNHLTTQQAAEKIIDNIRNNPNNPVARSQADKMLQTMKNLTVGQISGIRLQTFSEGYPSGFGEVVYTTNNYIYVFDINDGNGQVGISEEKLLDQILSTFKFTP